MVPLHPDAVMTPAAHVDSMGIHAEQLWRLWRRRFRRLPGSPFATFCRCVAGVVGSPLPHVTAVLLLGH